MSLGVPENTLDFHPFNKGEEVKTPFPDEIQVAPQGNRTLCVGFKMKDFLSQLTKQLIPDTYE